MGQTKKLVMLAGVALCMGTSAFAQQSNTDEIRSVVAEMLADAETRSSLLSAGDAGHDGRFFIAGDGFRLNVGGHIQFRYIANFRDDRPGQDDFESGFQTGTSAAFATRNATTRPIDAVVRAPPQFQSSRTTSVTWW